MHFTVCIASRGPRQRSLRFRRSLPTALTYLRGTLHKDHKRRGLLWSSLHYRHCARTRAINNWYCLLCSQPEALHDSCESRLQHNPGALDILLLPSCGAAEVHSNRQPDMQLSGMLSAQGRIPRSVLSTFIDHHCCTSLPVHLSKVAWAATT